MHKKPRRIVTIERRRNQLQKRIVSYIKTRDRLIKELSEKTGISEGGLSKLERGQGNPTRETLERIAKALGKKLKIYFE